MFKDEKSKHADARGYLFLVSKSVDVFLFRNPIQVLQSWMDEVRVWNTTFPLLCLEYIAIPHGPGTGLWIPDLAVVSANSFMELTTSTSYQVKIYSNGRSEFAPGGLIRFKCSLNLRIFPFDSMICTARTELWFYSAEKEFYDESQKELNLLNFSDHEQWSLQTTYIEYRQLYYETSGYSYNNAFFNVVLKRKSGYYLVNLILPSITLSLLESVTFILTESHAIRIQVSVLLLLAYTMFLAIIQADLPKSADETPLLTIYVTLMIFYIALAVMFQCVVLKMTNKAAEKAEIPAWLLRWSGLQKQYGPESDNNGEMAEQPTNSVRSIFQMEDGFPSKFNEHVKRVTQEDKNRMFWTRLYVSVDRAAASVYCSLIAVTSIVLLLIVPNKNI